MLRTNSLIPTVVAKIPNSYTTVGRRVLKEDAEENWAITLCATSDTSLTECNSSTTQKTAHFELILQLSSKQ